MDNNPASSNLSQLAIDAALDSRWGEALKYNKQIIKLDPQNVDALKKNGVFVFLNASLKTLVKRMGDDSNRPFLTNAKTRHEEIEKLLKERESLYRKAADKIIETDNLDPNKVTATILLNIKEKI